MKFIVFSDSHGVSDNMIRAVQKEKPDLCFFLGDGERDLSALQKRFPRLPINAVRGNCDVFSSLPRMLVCAAGLNGARPGERIGAGWQTRGRFATEPMLAASVEWDESVSGPRRYGLLKRPHGSPPTDPSRESSSGEGVAQPMTMQP